MTSNVELSLSIYSQCKDVTMIIEYILVRSNRFYVCRIYLATKPFTFIGLDISIKTKDV